MIQRRTLLVEMMVLGAAILLLAALGPFGSYAKPIGERLAQWALFLLGGYVFFRPILTAGRVLASHSGLPRPVAVILACLFAALPTSLIVILAFAGFRWREVTVGNLAEIYLQVVIVGIAVTGVQQLVRRGPGGVEEGRIDAVGRGAPGVVDPAVARDVGTIDAGDDVMDGRAVVSVTLAPLTPAPVPPEPDVASAGAELDGVLDAPFLDMLPPQLGRALICLENEDHYVRVHTALGSALILMRMRDAVAQLHGADGERVHRGWWVSRHAVADVVRRERNISLRLTDGREVPVARANVATLRARGWLTGLRMSA
jgi:hypothetical protein